MANLKKLIHETDIRCEVVSASSFSADMNLSQESDIDFFLAVDDSENPEALMKLSNALCRLGLAYNKYIFNDSERNYHSFEAITRGGGLKVEIEVKLAFKKTVKRNLTLHTYIDSKVAPELKTLFTYAKLLLLPDKKEYMRLKLIFYTYICHLMKSQDLSFILPQYALALPL